MSETNREIEEKYRKVDKFKKDKEQNEQKERMLKQELHHLKVQDT